MKRTITILTLLLFVVLFQRCTRTSQASENEVLFEIETYPCFGECPVYTMEIYQDGSYSYIGERHVEIQGQKNGQLDKGQMKRVKALISTNNFFEVEVENNYQIQDLPEKVLKSNLNGKKRELNYYYPKVEELDIIIEGIYQIIIEDINKKK